MGAAAALAVPSIIQLGGSIYSAITGKSAASKAADAQVLANKAVIDNTNQAVTGGKNDIATGTTNANDILSRSAKSQLDLYSPYIQAGQEAVGGIQALAGAGGPLDKEFSFNPTDLEKDPGYAFALKQGQAAINRAAAARGGLFSSTTMKGLADYTTGASTQYFDNAYKRAADTFNINRQGALARIGTMQGLASMGLSGTSGAAGAVANTSSQQAGNAENQGLQFANLGMQGNQTISNALTRTGDSKAAGIVGGQNAINAGISGAGNAISNAALNSFLLKRGVFGGNSNAGAGQQPAGPGWSGGSLPDSWNAPVNYSAFDDAS